MHKGELQSIQQGLNITIGVSKKLMDSDKLLYQLMTVIKHGPSPLFRNSIEIMCEIISSIPTCVSSFIEKE